MGSDGVARGMTCNAVSSVSLTPPLLLVCMDRRSRTLAAVHDRGGFAVNFLAAGRGDVSQLFATDRDDKFVDLAVRPSQYARQAPLLVDDAAASAECLVHDVINAGDHHIVLGRVIRCTVYGRPPLTYFNRSYDCWPSAVATGGVRH
jgi:flavin reductase (DIM6/NTAB) family NADH-FMN oxidoreductase RutF